MPLTLLKRFRRRFGGEKPDGDSDDNRFVPSPLELSVRYAHGSGEREADREIRRIQEQAEQFDDRHR